MTIPIVTRTVTIERQTDDGAGDPIATPDVWAVRTANAPAHIGVARGVSAGTGGEQVDAFLYLNTDQTITRLDRVTDNATGNVYAVVWLQKHIGLGLNHWKIAVRRVAGEMVP